MGKLVHLFSASLLGVVLLLALASSDARGEVPLEYEVKAAFVFRFAQYIDWPPSAMPNDSAPIVVGIIGDSPFTTAFRDLIQNKTVGTHPIVWKTYSEVPTETVHILFIPNSERRRIPQVLAAIRDRSILTVGESENFALEGGIVNFIRVQDKVHFEINVDAAQRAQLKISSRLLKLAHIIGARE